MDSSLLREVVKRISPTAGELKEERRFAADVVRRVQKNVPRRCRVVLTGSVAKGTFLRDAKDVDVFVLFPKTQPKDMLEAAIERIVKKSFPGVGYRLSYAEHPYARFHFQGRRIDLVPAYSIKNAQERVSAVDRSVLHTAFVLSKLKKGQVSDVLLLKAFLKSNSLYGAEIKTRGFSGYLCELLILKYGSFQMLARQALKWKKPVFIDIKGHYSKKEIPGAVDYFGDFVVIDPTDKNRNVAAAVSQESLAKFIRHCRRFIAKPKPEFFLKDPESFRNRVLRVSRGHKLFTITMPRPDVVDDVLWGQLHKMVNQLQAYLSDFSPKAILADDSVNEITLAVILKNDQLGDKELLAGPPLYMEKHVRSFRKSHRGARFMVKKKKLYAIVKRELVSAESAIRGFFMNFSRTSSHLACSENLLVLEQKK